MPASDTVPCPSSTNDDSPCPGGVSSRIADATMQAPTLTAGATSPHEELESRESHAASAKRSGNELCCLMSNPNSATLYRDVGITSSSAASTAHAASFESSAALLVRAHVFRELPQNACKHGSASCCVRPNPSDTSGAPTRYPGCRHSAFACPCVRPTFIAEQKSTGPQTSPVEGLRFSCVDGRSRSAINHAHGSDQVTNKA